MTIDSLKNKLKTIEEQGKLGYTTENQKFFLRKWYLHYKTRLNKLESAPGVEKQSLGI